MDFLTTLFIAIGLSLDATAVSLSYGAISKNNNNNAYKLSISFGLFQMFMAILGWAIGKQLIGFFEQIDHWIAFGLLSAVGIKMIYESFVLEKNENTCIISFNTLMMLSIATSIDSFAVGLSLGILKVSMFIPVFIIGLTTFLMSLISFYLGKKIGCFFENQMERIAGIILILIGFKILFEHLY